MVYIYSTKKEYNPARIKRITRAITSLFFMVCLLSLMIVLGVAFYHKINNTTSHLNKSLPNTMFLSQVSSGLQVK